MAENPIRANSMNEQELATKHRKERIMAEIIDHIRLYGAPCTLWISKDAEGRRTYAATRNRGGVPIEPQSGWVYGRGLAVELLRENLKLEEIQNNTD